MAKIRVSPDLDVEVGFKQLAKRLTVQIKIVKVKRLELRND